jgi:thiol:disulfide interchange protein DsbD
MLVASRSAVSILMMLVILLAGVGRLSAQFGLPQGGDEPEQTIVKVSSVLSVSSAKPGVAYDAATVATVIPGWHINSAKPYQEWLIPTKLTFDTVSGVTPGAVSYPGSIDAKVGDEMMSVYDARVVLRYQVTIDKAATPGEIVLPVRFTYQPCNNRECRAPQKLEADLRITVGGQGERINSEIFGATGARPTAATPQASTSLEENDFQKLINKYGFWGYLIALGLAFLTGLLLSFSPCTYPMIPITVSIFAGQDRSMGRGFVLSLFYVGSMAVVYGIMGLIVALVGGVFGAWLASTPVVVGIAIVFVIFSLSMFGVYELQVPMWLRQRLGASTSYKGVGGSILLGVVAALVVSPCVGPFVAGILLYIATNGSPIVGFLVLFVFALGLGALYVIIGTFSSAIKALPGSGGWMESVKKFFGFVLLLMAIYFLRTIISPSLAAVLTGLILMAFAVFGGGLDRLSAESGFFARVKKFLGIIAFLIGAYLLIGSMLVDGFILPPAQQWLSTGGVVTSLNKPDLIDWETDLQAGLERAAREGKPILVDTWATWCVNCRVLDSKTFHNPVVADEAKRFVAIKVQLETAGSEITKDFTGRFGLKQFSLPTTLLLDAKGNVIHTMTGVVEPEEMLAEMRKVQ